MLLKNYHFEIKILSSSVLAQVLAHDAWISSSSFAFLRRYKACGKELRGCIARHLVSQWVSLRILSAPVLPLDYSVLSVRSLSFVIASVIRLAFKKEGIFR